MSPSGTTTTKTPSTTPQKRSRPTMETEPGTDVNTQAKKPALENTGETVDLRVETQFGVPADVLFDVLVDGGKQAEAIGAACWDGKLTVGKAWTAADNYCSGTVLHMIPSKLLVQTWRASAWPSTTPSSTVITQLLPRYQSPNETRVILTHYGVPAGEIAERIESGWMEYVFEPIRVYLKDEKSKRAKRSGRNMAHVEIPAVDPERAGAFYKEVFGWDVSKWAEGYWGFTSGPRDHEWGFVDGGFPQATPTKPIVDHTKYAALTPYYDAYPVEEFEEKVKKAGGKVLKPKSATPYGVIAECEDTEGNAFVLYQMKAE